MTLALSALADGVPEPGYVMYGAIRDINTGGTLVNNGSITWTILPTGGGAPVTVSAALTNINGQFCYRVRVPFETLIGSTTVSTNALTANAAPTSYNRTQVMVNGVAATLNPPALGAFSFKAADRAMAEQVDLNVSIPAGQPESLRRWTLLDSDGDGVPDAQELLAGTSISDAKDNLRFESIQKTTNGIQMQWKSVTGRVYALSRTEGMNGTNAVVLATNLPGMAPSMSFTDTNVETGGPYFYRVQVQ